MWTLWIISSVIGLDEPRLTRYDEYKTAQDCLIAWHEITSEFKENELAFCEEPNGKGMAPSSN